MWLRRSKRVQRTAVKCLLTGLFLASTALTAVGSEILIDEFADFTQINGGYSDGTTAGETIILNEGVMFSFEILDNENYIAYGLYSEAQGVTLRNNGTIIANSVWDETLWEEVPEDPAGIAFFGKHGKIVNYGVLDINSPYGSGIQVGHQYPDIGLSGSDTTIWNYGKIFVDDTRQGDGYAHAGITAYTYRVGIFNAGEITIQADTHDSGSGFTYGIFSKAPYDLFISNAGTIKTYGKAGRGIYVELGVGNNEHFDRELQANARGTVVNSGLIEVFGGGNKPLPKNPYNSGIRIAYPGQGPQASVINTGTIKAHHPAAMGITAYSGRTHIINSGYVMGGHSAINTENGYTDVHLLAGSRLVGNIAFGAAPLDIKDRNRVTFGAGLNAIVRHTLGPVGINGVHGKLPNRIDAVDDAFLMAEDTVYALDLSTEQTARHRMMTGLGRNVSNGVRFAQCGGGSGSGGGGLNLAGAAEASFWNQPFGSSIISDGDDGMDNVLIDDFDVYDPFDTYAAFEGGQLGSLFGFCDPLGSFRLFAGFMYGWVKTSDSDHFDSESYGGFAGVQGQWTDALSYTFTTGYLRHDTDHEVSDSRLDSGVTSTSDDYGTIFVMPSLSFVVPIPEVNWLSHGTLRVSYLGTLQDERTIKMDDAVAAVLDQTFAHELNVRAELHAPLQLVDQPGMVRIGVEAVGRSGEYDLAIAGQHVTEVSSALEGFTARGFIGAHIGPVGFEIGYDNNDILDASASVTVRF